MKWFTCVPSCCGFSLFSLRKKSHVELPSVACPLVVVVVVVIVTFSSPSGALPSSPPRSPTLFFLLFLFHTWESIMWNFDLHRPLWHAWLWRWLWRPRWRVKSVCGWSGRSWKSPDRHRWVQYDMAGTPFTYFDNLPRSFSTTRWKFLPKISSASVEKRRRGRKTRFSPRFLNRDKK